MAADPKLYIDFETRSTVDLRKTGADAYALHPSTDILCMGYAFDEEPVAVWVGPNRALPARIVKHIDLGHEVVAHNAAFEWSMWQYVGVERYGWQPLPISQTVCTAAMAYANAFPAKLEHLSDALKMDLHKDTAGARLMLKLCKPRRYDANREPIWWDDINLYQRLYEYCKRDVEVTRKVYGRLVKLSEHERTVYEFDHKINQRGAAIDFECAIKAKSLVKFTREFLRQKIQKATKGAVESFTSIAQIRSFLESEGLFLESVSRNELTKIVDSPEINEACKTVINCRLDGAKTSVAKLDKFIEGVCPDSRMRGLFQYHAASTGRWGGRRVQPQNLPRPSLNQRQIEEVFEILKRIELVEGEEDLEKFNLKIMPFVRIKDEDNGAYTD